MFGSDDLTFTPGAETSGLIRSVPVPPHIEGPRLEKLAIGYPDVLPSTAPTQKTFTESVLMFFGGVIVEAPEPELPAEKQTAIPAASRAFKVGT